MEGLRDLLADEIAHFPIGTGYCSTSIGYYEIEEVPGDG